MKVLLVEDDHRQAELLTFNLKEHGFLVSHVPDLSELEHCFKSDGRVDFIILDRLLGGVDSKDSLKEIRDHWPQAPILVLSAISTPNERTDLLNLGADDYLGKPFSSSELIARMRALLRRTATPIGAYTQVGNLVIDSVHRTISVAGNAEALPAKEFLLIHTLGKEPGRIWSKHALLDYVWGQNSDVETNVVEATMAKLRKKLFELQADVIIKNMRNSGYWIELQVSQVSRVSHF